MSKIMITGIAGFIGFHLAKKLSNHGHEVSGLDNYNTYYDASLKIFRANILNVEYGVKISRIDISNIEDIGNIMEHNKPDLIIHLAAHAGVRHSLGRATEYIQNNIVATQNLIDVCETFDIQNVIYASTSCVMAGNELPWKEDEPTLHQLNPYGYTKRTNECQFKTSGIKRNIGLRFFTVYGPYGRPDMALFKFTKNIIAGIPIDVFNYGAMKRDFTYVDDIVQGINILTNHILEKDQTPISEIYNIGNGQQVDLMDFIAEIETQFSRTAIKNFMPPHPADSLETWSDTTKLQKLGYKPTTSIKEGVEHFANWYKTFYSVN